MIRAFAAVTAFFLFVGLLWNGIDYGFHGIAMLTHDSRWDTDSFKDDRFMNGLTLKSVFHAGSRSTISVTFDNPTDQTKNLGGGMISCSEHNSYGDTDWSEIIPDTWVVGPQETITYTMRALDHTGDNMGEDDFTQGEIPCRLAL